MNNPLDLMPYLSHGYNRYSREEWIAAGNSLSVFLTPRSGYEQDESKYL